MIILYNPLVGFPHRLPDQLSWVLVCGIRHHRHQTYLRSDLPLSACSAAFVLTGLQRMPGRGVQSGDVRWGGVLSRQSVVLTRPHLLQRAPQLMSMQREGAVVACGVNGPTLLVHVGKPPGRVPPPSCQRCLLEGMKKKLGVNERSREQHKLMPDVNKDTLGNILSLRISKTRERESRTSIVIRRASGDEN